ncbi:hypothetical protein Lfu02_56090 [Longispora fulva]|nr:hypothetical protein Lfu02_56090 [Longispora fulva]
MSGRETVVVVTTRPATGADGRRGGVRVPAVEDWQALPKEACDGVGSHGKLCRDVLV